MNFFFRPLSIGLLALLLSAPAASRAQGAAIEPAAPPPVFDILAYDIEGNTLLDEARIERAVLPFMGPGRKMDDVEAARNALEQQFQQAGYLTVGVDIPEQRVEDGLVRLVVVQGRVGALYVSGSKYHSQGWIRERVAEFAPGRVPDFNRAQQQLALVNRSDDRRVQPVLKPGRLPGTVDIDLQVDDRLPLSGTIELNNQHAAGTEPIKAIATLRYDNLQQRDRSLSLMIQGAPLKTSESQVVVLGYTEPLDTGDSLSLSLIHSNSDVASLGGTQVLGNGTIWGLRRSIALGDNGQGPVLSLGLDYKRLSEKTRFGQAEIATPLTYLPFQLGWSQGWVDGPQRAQFSANWVFATRRLFQRQVDCPLADGSQGRADQFACKRQGGDGSFGALRLDGRWSLAPDPVGITLRLAAQGASGPLASAEQFSLGGADTVRGYAEGEAAGDQGWLGSVEVRSPNLVPMLDAAEGWRDFNLLAFIDLARADTFQAAAGQPSRVSLGAAGIGWRGIGSTAAGGLEGAFDLAWPLRATANTALRDLHLHARVQARF